MASSTPLVLEGISLLDFIQYVLNTHNEPSTLIVCSSRETFLGQMQDALNEIPKPQQDGESEEITNDQVQPNVRKRAWRTPTLRLLASSRTVKVVFCQDVPHLRAYLATYAHRASKHSDYEHSTNTASNSGRLLAVLDLINLHRPTSTFSAQGLNRTLATAVEAAHHSNSRLILAEGFSKNATVPTEDPLLFGEEPAPPVLPITNPWDEEVSILNVTTKSFGAGERGWVGRTVKIRTIAERWCAFQLMPTAEE